MIFSTGEFFLGYVTYRGRCFSVLRLGGFLRCTHISTSLCIGTDHSRLHTSRRSLAPPWQWTTGSGCAVACTPLAVCVLCCAPLCCALQPARGSNEGAFLAARPHGLHVAVLCAARRLTQYSHRAQLPRRPPEVATSWMAAAGAGR